MIDQRAAGPGKFHAILESGLRGEVVRGEQSAGHGEGGFGVLHEDVSGDSVRAAGLRVITADEHSGGRDLAAIQIEGPRRVSILRHQPLVEGDGVHGLSAVPLAVGALIIHDQACANRQAVRQGVKAEPLRTDIQGTVIRPARLHHAAEAGAETVRDRRRNIALMNAGVEQ